MAVLTLETLLSGKRALVGHFPSLPARVECSDCHGLSIVEVSEQS